MGFLSYSLGFYRETLQTLERAPVTADSLDLARRLLRMLDDLAYEGYDELEDQLERSFRGVSRLRAYLQRNRAAAFAPPERRAGGNAVPYASQDIDLHTAILQAMRAADALPEAPAPPFADRLLRFCRWIGYDEQMAYIFLLRDMLLPFVFFLSRGRTRIHPWLLSRSSFAALTGRPNADDALRASVYSALEAGCTDFRSFTAHALPDMRRTMAQHPQAERALRAMLSEIDAKRILVIESGCAGTFPLLLMSLDPRVDLRMYTTYPYLTGILGERLFMHRYEELLSLETMVSQERYLRFSALRNGRFYVRRCTDAEVERRSLQEIKTIMK